MEPMTLGSAPSSPSSPTLNPNYLPSFLMGEHQATSPNLQASPERNRNYAYNLATSPESNFSHNLFHGMNISEAHQHSIISSPVFDAPAQEKPGPPKHSLFDTLEVKKSISTPPKFSKSQHSFRMDSPSMHDLSRKTGANRGLSEMNESGALSDSFNILDSTSRNDLHPNLWVTVFGFNPNCASIVLGQFATCGTIIDKRFPAQGNWAHLKYNSPNEVAKALSFNGKIVANCVMVGVIPHQSKQANKENMETSSSFNTPIRCRPLRHSFASPQNSNTVLPPQNVPQKSTGLVTKAMEYVFGW